MNKVIVSNSSNKSMHLVKTKAPPRISSKNIKVDSVDSVLKQYITLMSNIKVLESNREMLTKDVQVLSAKYEQTQRELEYAKHQTKQVVNTLDANMRRFDSYLKKLNRIMSSSKTNKSNSSKQITDINNLIKEVGSNATFGAQRQRNFNSAVSVALDFAHENKDARIHMDNAHPNVVDIDTGNRH